MPTINRKYYQKGTKRTNNREIASKYVYNTTRWSQLRNVKIKRDPLCEECLKDDRVEPATQVHHIKPFMLGATIEQIKHLAFDWFNLQSLCESCHKGKHTSTER